MNATQNNQSVVFPIEGIVSLYMSFPVTVLFLWRKNLSICIWLLYQRPAELCRS